MKGRLSIALLFIGSLLLSCGDIGKYQVNKPLLEQSSLFNSSQAPEFYMQLEDGLAYVGEANYRVNESGLSITVYVHYFMNKERRYAISVTFASMTTGEWQPYEPWRWPQPNEFKGKTEYLCGMNRLSLKMSEKEKAMLEPLGMHDGQTISQKIWVNKYSGLRGTRIIVRYTEKGNQMKKMKLFSERANERTNFFHK